MIGIAACPAWMIMWTDGAHGQVVHDLLNHDTVLYSGVSMTNVDPKSAVSAGLAAVGALALIASGYLTVTTPGEQQCQIELADQKARLELLTERVRILEEAKDACKVALISCSEGGLQ